MEFDWPHMAVTAVIIGVVVYIVNHTGSLAEASKGKRTLVTFVILFVALLILNLLWPYGGG